MTENSAPKKLTVYDQAKLQEKQFEHKYKHIIDGSTLASKEEKRLK